MSGNALNPQDGVPVKNTVPRGMGFMFLGATVLASIGVALAIVALVFALRTDHGWRYEEGQCRVTPLQAANPSPTFHEDTLECWVKQPRTSMEPPMVEHDGKWTEAP